MKTAVLLTSETSQKFATFRSNTLAAFTGQFCKRETDDSALC
jgi:hypothetical protein